MRIPINRKEKIVLLKWLQKGVIDTDDIPALKKDQEQAQNAWFGELIKRRTEKKDINNQNL